MQHSLGQRKLSNFHQNACELKSRLQTDGQVDELLEMRTSLIALTLAMEHLAQAHANVECVRRRYERTAKDDHRLGKTTLRLQCHRQILVKDNDAGIEGARE